MGWLTALLRKKWLPYVAILCVVTVTGTYFYGFARGQAKADARHAKALNKALAEQMEQLAAIHSRDIANLSRRGAQVENVRQRIEQVERPNECRITPECLRAFNAGVLATGTNPQ